MVPAYFLTPPSFPMLHTVRTLDPVSLNCSQNGTVTVGKIETLQVCVFRKNVKKYTNGLPVPSYSLGKNFMSTLSFSA